MLGTVENASKYHNSGHRLAYTLNNLGSVAQDQGRYFEAEKYYRRAIACWQDGGKRLPVGLAPTLNNLASLLDSAGKFAEAQELLQRSEAIESERIGWHDPAIAVVFINRGIVYFKQQRYREAGEQYRRAWTVWEPHRPSRDLDLARVAGDLGLVWPKTGRKKEAQSHYAFARGIWEKHVRSGKATLETVMNLAGLYSTLGQGLPAKLMLEEFLVVAERELGPEHPRFADMLFLYARVLHKAGSKAEAARITKQAKAILTDSQQRLARYTVSTRDLVGEARTK